VCLPPEDSIAPEARATARGASGAAAGAPTGVVRSPPVCFGGSCFDGNVVVAQDVQLLITPTAQDLQAREGGGGGGGADRRYM